jgi:hypothetical protein
MRWRGSWGDVLGDLGIEPEEDDPLVAESQRRFEERHERFFPSEQRNQLQAAIARFTGRDPKHLFDDPPASAPHSPQQSSRQSAETKARKHQSAEVKARKQKNKRKAELASRKANRRKRK